MTPAILHHPVPSLLHPFKCPFTCAQIGKRKCMKTNNKKKRGEKGCSSSNSFPCRPSRPFPFRFFPLPPYLWGGLSLFCNYFHLMGMYPLLIFLFNPFILFTFFFIIFSKKIYPTLTSFQCCFCSFSSILSNSASICYGCVVASFAFPFISFLLPSLPSP